MGAARKTRVGATGGCSLPKGATEQATSKPGGEGGDEHGAAAHECDRSGRNAAEDETTTPSAEDPEAKRSSKPERH